MRHRGILKSALLSLCGAALGQVFHPTLSRADFNRGSIGTSSANFLKMGMGARSKAMGDNFTAVADDASAIYWNPAGLSQLAFPSLLMMHSSYVSSILHDTFAYAMPLRERMGFGLGLQYLSFGNIQELDQS